MANINFNNIKFVASYGTASQLPEKSKPEIAFVGRSNVGKSSLLNKICNNKNLAKVSSTPGKTSTINFFDANTCYFVDLPGYGYAKRAKSELVRWSNLIDEYFASDRVFALVIVLLDVRHEPSDLDIQMINYIHEIGLPFIIVMTKADKLSKQQQSHVKEKLYKNLGFDQRIPVYLCSSEKNIGISELRNIIQELS